jgi:hypothetical protein
LRNPVAQHHRTGELVVLLRLLRVVLDVRHRHVESGDIGARALRHDRDQPEMIDVLVGHDHQLDVLDGVAECGQPTGELLEGGGRVGARVNERERLVLDQVDVDPPDREGGGDGYPVNPRSCRHGLEASRIAVRCIEIWR